MENQCAFMRGRKFQTITVQLNEEVEIPIVKIDYKAGWKKPAHITADPHTSTPAEGDDPEIHAVWHKLKDRNGNYVEVDIFPMVNENRLVETISELGYEKPEPDTLEDEP
jgi:hypothetical protein